MADRKYKCLNPVGIQDPVESLSPYPPPHNPQRQEHLFQHRCRWRAGYHHSPYQALQSDYPEVNWHITTAAEHRTIAGSSALSEEEMKTADA